MADKIDKFLTTRVIYHGPGALARLDGEIHRLGGKRVGLITDQGIAKAGIRDRVLQVIRAEVFCFDAVVPEPPYEAVDQCVQSLKENRCDLIVGLGGGSCMDTAKMAAVMMTNGGKVPDYLGVDRIPRPGLPVIAIPTTAGTGSEVSPASVFVDSRDQAKKGVRSDFILPEVAILDPILTLELPRPLTASTGMDALTHAIETYTALRATMMSDILAERAIRLIADNLRRAYANGNDLPARDGMLMGSLLAGMALAVANVGGVHALAQTMGGMHRIPHGIANSVLLPYVMEFNRMACRERYAKIADLLAGPVQGLALDEASRRAVQAVRDLIRDLHLPQHLRELDITEDSLRLIAERCMETQGRILSNNPRAISVGEAEGILREAL
jgi:alcohol dehydrogenase class IV